ncbi:MAG: hypothetical protein QXS54_06730 [Candidatus Methanomethylicaceae archaeon]
MYKNIINVMRILLGENWIEELEGNDEDQQSIICVPDVRRTGPNGRGLSDVFSAGSNDRICDRYGNPYGA